MKERRKGCRCIHGEVNNIYRWWHLIVLCLFLPPPPPPRWFQGLYIVHWNQSHSTKYTCWKKMYAWAYFTYAGASIFSFLNTQASTFIVSVSAAIQKQTFCCSPYSTLAHFQRDWVFLASHQCLPWNQTTKTCRWWQTPRWLQQKKSCFSKNATTWRLHGWA